MFAEEIVENGLPKKWIIAGVITVILGIFVLNAFGVVGPTERGVICYFINLGYILGSN